MEICLISKTQHVSDFPPNFFFISYIDADFLTADFSVTISKIGNLPGPTVAENLPTLYLRKCQKYATHILVSPLK